jgi:competence protein ComEA
MDPLRYRKPLLALVVGALALLLLVQRVQGSGGARPVPAPVHAAPRSATGTPPGGQLVVDVVGAVRRPGLYRLSPGTRVADAVQRAGGATAHANLELLNLAAPLADGEQVVVPRAGTTSAAADGAPAGAAQSAAPLQLSVATAEQLDALPGVGPATAAKIVAYRLEHGPFHSVDDLVGVPGIGPAKLAGLKDLVVP